MGERISVTPPAHFMGGTQEKMSGESAFQTLARLATIAGPFHGPQNDHASR
jgi:hypothetical protein